MLRKSLILLLLLGVAGPACAEIRWFVVAERDPVRNESFLLPLSDPEHVAQARARIAQGEASGVGSIASVRIARGTDGLNRNLRAAGQPLWSWHVVEFEGFADNAIELCDGWPGLIESDVDGFIANTSGRACFWGYSVVEELAAPPPFAIHEVVHGAWFNPATPGQGMFVQLLPQRAIYVAWLTWEQQPGPVVPVDTQHRWFTAFGSYTGARADLTIYRSRGGVFDSAVPVVTDAVGTLRLDFAACDRAVARYTFTGTASGEIPLQPLVSRCAD